MDRIISGVSESLSAVSSPNVVYSSSNDASENILTLHKRKAPQAETAKESSLPSLDQSHETFGGVYDSGTDNADSRAKPSLVGSGVPVYTSSTDFTIDTDAKRTDTLAAKSDTPTISPPSKPTNSAFLPNAIPTPGHISA